MLYITIKQDRRNKKENSHEGHNIESDCLPIPWQHVDWTLYRSLLSLVKACLADPLVEQWQPCVRQYFQLKELSTWVSLRSIWNLFAYLAIILIWWHIAHAIYHLFATIWKKINTLKRSTYPSLHFSVKVLHFNLFNLSIGLTTA